MLQRNYGLQDLVYKGLWENSQVAQTPHACPCTSIVLLVQKHTHADVQREKRLCQRLSKY